MLALSSSLPLPSLPPSLAIALSPGNGIVDYKSPATMSPTSLPPDHFHSFLRCAAVGILLSLPVRRPLSSSFSPKCTEKVASSSPGAHELVPLIDALMLVRHYLCMIVDECGFRVAGVTCLYEGIERDAVALMSS